MLVSFNPRVQAICTIVFLHKELLLASLKGRRTSVIKVGNEFIIQTRQEAKVTKK